MNAECSAEAGGGRLAPGGLRSSRGLRTNQEPLIYHDPPGSLTALRYALISDIHANLPALEAVLAHLDGLGDRPALYHLGDLVGYAPWPNETVALIRDRAIPGVAGNYDSTIATGYKHCGCRVETAAQEELSHRSYSWTAAAVTAETKAFLAALPFRLDLRPRGGHEAGPKLVLVHGTPARNTLYWTQDRPDDFCLTMARQAGATAGDVIAFGHTHLPWHREVDGIHFINTGSVGRPKDGDWRAGLVMVEMGAAPVRVDFIRVAYDLDRAVDGILGSTLPAEFAGQLRSGGAAAAAG